METYRKIAYIRQFIIAFVLTVFLVLFGNSEKGTKIQIYLNSIFSAPIQAYSSFFFNTFRIRQENKTLRKKVVELTLNNKIMHTYKDENSTLKSLLDFKEQSKYKLLPAAIINKPSVLFAETFSINKGQLDGVEKNLPVITQNGIYGKIIEVTPYTAIVQTLFNFNFRAGGLNQRNGIQGLVRWTPQKGCIFEQVPLYSDIKLGDQIVTSGLGGVFPKGLAIGTVKEINLDKTKLYYSITLDLSSDFTKTSYVFVMKLSTEQFAKEDSSILETSFWTLVKKDDSNKWEANGIEQQPSRPKNFPVKFEMPEPTIRTE